MFKHKDGDKPDIVDSNMGLICENCGESLGLHSGYKCPASDGKKDACSCDTCLHKDKPEWGDPCVDCCLFRKWEPMQQPTQQTTSDGSTASYYELPDGATELQHLISHRNMNAQIGEIFRACYRYGLVSHSPCERDIKKIIFYAQAELERLKKCQS